MKRRRAVISIGALGLIGLGGLQIGKKLNLFTRRPDLKFLDNQLDVMEELVELIIPATNTPGAAACQVHKFVILMVKEAADHRSKINFIEGLRDLESYAREEYGRKFLRLETKEKVQVLSHFEQKGEPLPGLVGKAKNKFFGKSFFEVLKSYTSIGYCTSRDGATKALAYVPVPTKYLACVELSDYPKSWATE